MGAIATDEIAEIGVLIGVSAERGSEIAPRSRISVLGRPASAASVLAPSPSARRSFEGRPSFHVGESACLAVLSCNEPHSPHETGAAIRARRRSCPWFPCAPVTLDALMRLGTVLATRSPVSSEQGVAPVHSP